MKKIAVQFLTAVMCAISGLIAASCCDASGIIESTLENLEVGKSRIEAPAIGLEEEIKITSNTSWTIGQTPSWLTVIPPYGNGDATIKAIIAENDDFEPRTCTIDFSLGGDSIFRQIQVHQEGKEVILETEPKSVTLDGDANSQDVIKVISNIPWTLSGMPEWLGISETSGEESKILILTAITENDTYADRLATLKIESERKSIEVAVRQTFDASLAKVTPVDITTLPTEMCFMVEATEETATFQYLLLTEAEMSLMSNKEIAGKLFAEQEHTPSNEFIAYHTGLTSDTQYYICTIAKDKAGETGELVKTPARTKTKTDDIMNEAFVNVDIKLEDMDEKEYIIRTDFKKLYKCDSYHAIYGTNLGEAQIELPKVFYAFQINYYNTHGKKHAFAEKWDLQILLNCKADQTLMKSHKSSTQNPYAIGYAIGIYEDGEMSTEIYGKFGKVDLQGITIR